MSWNYRILAHKYRENEVYFQIHEVYYDKSGIPNGYAKDAEYVGADDVEGLQWTLDRMQECLSKPILSVENFPEKYTPNSD